MQNRREFEKQMIKQNDKIAFSESDTLGKSIDPIHRHFASKYPFSFLMYTCILGEVEGPLLVELD